MCTNSDRGKECTNGLPTCYAVVNSRDDAGEQRDKSTGPESTPSIGRQFLFALFSFCLDRDELDLTLIGAGFHPFDKALDLSICKVKPFAFALFR